MKQKKSQRGDDMYPPNGNMEEILFCLQYESKCAKAKQAKSQL